MTTKYIHCKSQEHFAYRKMPTMHTECIFHTPISVLKTVKIYLRTHTQCSIIYLCCFPRLGMYWCAQTCKVILENQNIIRDLGYTSVLKPVRLYLRTHTYMKMYLSIFLCTMCNVHSAKWLVCRRWTDLARLTPHGDLRPPLYLRQRRPLS